MITIRDVRKILCENILLGLEMTGASSATNKWCVVEYANFNMVKVDKSVVVNLLRRKRVGWQGVSYLTVGNDYSRKDEWISEEHYQIHVMMKRTQNEPYNTSPLDVAEMLITWFNGRGCDELRKKGLANLRIDSDQIIVYNDDSDLYQKRAVFTVKIQVPKELTMKQADMTAKLDGIYGV